MVNPGTPRWAIRTGIIFFWLSIIIIFLCIPFVSKFFEPQKSLSIYVPPLILDSVLIHQFEQETGISVYVTYIDNPATLMNKLEITKGQGYDLIIADDHSVELLIKKNILKKIDLTQFSFYAALNPWLLNTYYDPTNEYSIPYYWGVYGIGYDNTIINPDTVEKSWSLIFNPALSPHTICMTDEPREAIMIAAQYLFGTIDALKDPISRDAVKKLLIDQKKHVQAYTLFLADNLLQTKSCPVATLMSPDMLRIKNFQKFINWFIPKEGSFMVIDALVVPALSHKDELVKQFIEFLLGLK